MRKRPIGIYEKALPSCDTWTQTLSVAADAGFDFFEIAVDEERLERITGGAGQRTIWREASAVSGLPILTMVLSAHRAFPLGSASAATRRKALDLMQQAIDFAQHVGVRMIQLAGYYVYEEPHTDGSRERYIEGLRQGALWAGQAGVMLGVENMDGEDVITMRDALSIVDDVRSPWLRLYPDVGNFTANGLDAAAEMVQGAGQIVGLHLKDTRLGEYRRVPFGEGKVPFEDVFRTLDDIGYAGPVSLEMWNDDSPHALEVVSQARTWIVERMDRKE